MPKYCCAPYCFNNNGDKKTRHFHVFPKDQIRRAEWKNRLNITKSPKKHMVVCSDHFEESDYFVSNHGQGDKEFLKKSSVPRRIPEENVNNNLVTEMTTDELREIYLSSENLHEPDNNVVILETNGQIDDELNNLCEAISSESSDESDETDAWDVGVQAAPEMKAVGIQANPDMKPVAIQAEPDIKEIGVQAAPELKPACIQTKAEVKNVETQANLPRKRSSFYSLSDDDLQYFTGLLNIPPFLKDKKRLSNYEVMKTRTIANRRILIENVNCRAKKNTILTTPMQRCLWPIANKIIYVCFALVNFYKPLK